MQRHLFPVIFGTLTPVTGIVLSANSVAEAATNGTGVGTFSAPGTTGTAFWSLTADGGGTFTVDNLTNVLTVLSNTAIASNGSFSITASVSGLTPNPPDFTTTVWVVPTAPVIALQAASDTGTSSSDGITSNNLPSFDFTATMYAGDIVQLLVGGVAYGSPYTITSADVSSGSATLGAPAFTDGAKALTATLSRGGYTSSASNTVNLVIDTQAPSLSSVTGTKTGTSTANLSISTTETGANAGTIYWTCDVSGTTPSPAQVKAGKDHTGSTTNIISNSVAASASPVTPTASGLAANTTYHVYSMQEDVAGNQSTVAVAAATFTTDASSAPTLSAATGTTLGSTTANLSVVTDTTSGTMWWVVVLASDSAPSDAQIRAGHNAANTAAVATNGAGGTSVSASPFKILPATGLSAGTAYKAYFTQDDLSSNHSNVAPSGSFTTSASFTAGDLTNLQGWYDAQNAGFSAGAISSWPDNSGKGNDLATIIGTATYGATEFNAANPGITFATGNNGVRKTSINFTGTKALIAIVAKCKVATQTVGARLFDLSAGGSDSTTPGVSIIHQGVAGSDYCYSNSAIPSGGTNVGQTAHAFFVTFDAAHAKLFVANVLKGSQVTFSSTIGSSTAELTFGCDASNATNWLGTLGEMIICTDDNTANLASLYTYLQGKWSGI